MVYLVSIRFFCPVLYLIACSFVYILFFFGITGALVIITVQGVSTPYRFLRQCSSAHSKSILTFPLALSLHNSAAILVHSVKFEINRKKMILSAEEDGFRHKAFSTLVDSCHTIPSTPPWTWSRLEPSVAAAYLAAAAPSRAPTQTPQAGQTGCYKLGSRTVAIFTRC